MRRPRSFRRGATLLAFVCLGSCVLAAKPNLATGRQTASPKIGVVAPQAENGLPEAISPEDLFEALGESVLVRDGAAVVVRLKTPGELTDALTRHAADYLAIINPMGESFLVADENDAQPMAARIKSFVEQGGLWWEVAGQPFTYPCWQERADGKVTCWKKGNLGRNGLALFGIQIALTTDMEPTPLQVTPLGQQILGEPQARSLVAERANANRAPLAGAADLVLLEVHGRPYISAKYVGKGMLWQVGGTDAHAAVVIPAVLGTCEYFRSHEVPEKSPPVPWTPPKPQNKRGGIQTFPDLEYARVGDRSLKLDLYLPDQREGKTPLIVCVHGGGWMAGSRKDMMGLDLVERGYAVASIDYRLIQEAVFPAQIHDCKAAIRWLRAHADKYGLDPDRFGVLGHSAGGHLAALLGTSGGSAALEGGGDNLDYSSRLQAVVDMAGPIDFVTDVSHADDPNFGPARLIGGTVAANREKAIAASPLTYITQDSPPFLILHGARDKLVPVAQAEILYDALKRAKVPATLMIRPWTGHGIHDPTTTWAIHQFLDKHLKP